MKTQMKNNVKPGGPDIESIISGLGVGRDSPPSPTQMPGKETESTITGDEKKGRLWDEFLAILNDPEEETEARSKKLYSIDDDIVETLHQCDFGKPNVEVINGILRTFLIDNIERLREMHRPRSASLLDKY